jgi:hypothetical protein
VQREWPDPDTASVSKETAPVSKEAEDKRELTTPRRNVGKPGRKTALLLAALETAGVKDRGILSLGEIARKVEPHLPKKLFVSEQALEKAIARSLPSAKGPRP